MRLNAFTTHATIRRKADIAPGFVILHSLGVVINTNVRAGRNLVVYHNVTLGESVDSTAFNPVMRTFLQDYRRNNPGGVLFDLNKYNARFCVTPEFPGGTYAYFESILADGTPFYPYHVGRWFFGNPTGGTTTD